METFDLVVIGAGTGGVSAASRAKELGLSVCLVEKGDMGGTCLNRGCIPTKVMAGAAHSAKHMTSVLPRLGFELPEPVPHRWDKLLDRCRNVVGTLQRGLVGRLKREGVIVKNGTGCLAGPYLVDIEGTDTGRVSGKSIVLALGSSPATIPGVKPNGKSILTSDDIFKMSERPASMVVVGGGAVGCEFASIFAAFGTRVTLLEMLPELLTGADTDVVKRLTNLLRRRKIDIRTGTRVTAISAGVPSGNSTSGLEVKVESQSGSDSLTVDMVLLATGRTFATSGLGLDSVGIETKNGAVIVDGHMKTSIPDHYAVGDRIGGKLLAHVAAMEGRIAAENAAGKDSVMSYRFIPWTVFTDPEVAWAGMTEKEASRRGIEIETQKTSFSSVSRAWVDGETDGILKCVADTRSKVVIGVHAVGPGVSHFVGEICVALKSSLTVEEWGRIVHAHPTMSEILMETFQQMST